MHRIVPSNSGETIYSGSLAQRDWSCRKIAAERIAPASVLLIRDALGVEEIYYSLADDGVLLSHSLRELQHATGAKMNDVYINNEYKWLQIPFSASTAWSGIYRVMPGECVEVVNRCWTPRPYWRPTFGQEKYRPEELRELIKKCVDEAYVRFSDKKSCAMLSGGLDSSTVRRLLPFVSTYTGFYREPGYSELDYAREVDPKTFDVEIQQYEFQRCAANIAKIVDEPSCGIGSVGQHIVGLRARANGAQVAFTGEGGDELFYGYAWQTAAMLADAGIQNSRRDVYLSGFGSVVDAARRGMPQVVASLICRNADLESVRQVERTVRSFWVDGDPIENNLIRITLGISLPAILQVDAQVGRSCGLVCVPPLADRRIADYVCSLAPEERAKVPKHLLREATQNILPERIRTRTNKMGFPIPLQQWDWPGLSETLGRLRDRKIMPVPCAKRMDRNAWYYWNIEKFMEYQEGSR